MSSSISQEPITIVDLPSVLPSGFGPAAAAGPSRTASCYCPHSPSFSRPTISFSLKRPSSKLQCFCNEFNRFVRTHCEWAPIGPPAAGGFASAEETPIEDDGPGIVEDDGAPLNGVGIEPAAKKVLILMSDTGGGHRASAEAIKAAFNQEFGDE